MGRKARASPVKAAQHFYLYGTFEEWNSNVPSDAFTFLIDSQQRMSAPCFLIWLYCDTNDRAVLCKVRRITKPANHGMRLHLLEAVPIRLKRHGLLNTIYPAVLDEGVPERDHVMRSLSRREIVSVPDDRFDVVKNVIIKSNSGTIDESYFIFDERSPNTELMIEATDAMHTGVRLTGFPAHDIPELREPQVLDFDMATLFDDTVRTGVSPDGKHFFEHGNRRVYLHKVHDTAIETCLGVDLIYNYLDQRRLVFVQYKCQKKRGRYYHGNDEYHDREVERMAAIPGLSDCFNVACSDLALLRLCRCPVFVKLCAREIANSHSIPVGVYFPLCVWRWQTKQRPGISVKDEPHINSRQFQELVRVGFIGSTRQQSVEIEQHLIAKANDSRLKLIFEEERIR